MKANGFFGTYFFIALILMMPLSFTACSKSIASEAEKGSVPTVSSTQYPMRGSDKATLKIEQFSDFFCPYCKKQAAVFNELREKYPDQIQMTFRHFPLSGEPGAGSFPMHEASVCSGEQGKFWEFHDYVLVSKTRVGVDEVVKAIGLKEDDFKSCMQAERGRGPVLEDLKESQARGVNGAPTFFINGEKISGLRPYDFFAEKVDPALAQKAADERKKYEDELLKKIDPSDAGRPSQGADNALVTITEFSDFHCPFCVRLTATLKKITEAYPQDVRHVWRHFPLPIHPYSPYAHLASECAHSQGQFWAFHEKVFADPGAAHSAADMMRIADALKLDADKFKACYEAPETKKKIENDVLLGMYKKVGSTPSFFINDEMFIGAKSFDDIKVLVERKLAEAKKEKAA